MTDPAPPKTPPGWYPEGTNGMRYWDGDAWTDHRAPNAAAAPRPKRGRNYLGDLSIVAAVVAVLAFFIWHIPVIVLIAAPVALILAIAGLSTARGTRSRVTAILGLVGSGVFVLYVLMGIAATALTR